MAMGTKGAGKRGGGPRDGKRLRDDGRLGDGLAGSFRSDVAGHIITCDRHLAEILGYDSPEELMAVPVAQLYFDVAERQRYIDQLFKAKRLVNYGLLLKHRTGRAVHVIESVSLQESPGRASILEGTVIDITGVRQAETDLRGQLEDQGRLLDLAGEALLVVKAGKVIYANAAAAGLVGKKPDAGTALDELLETVDGQPVLSMLDDLQEPGKWREATARLRNGGEDVPVRATSIRYGGGPAVLFALHKTHAERTAVEERLHADITGEVDGTLRAEIEEHRQTLEELKQNRRFARSLIDSSLDIIIAVDRDGKVTEFNPAASIKFGYEKEETMGRHSRMFYADSAEFERVKREMDRYGAYAGEVRNVDRDGKEFTCFLSSSRLFDDEEKLLGSMGVSRDVTQAKRDQEALRKSEERYRDLFENATDLIQSVDTSGRFLYVNNAWRNCLGYTDGELSGMTVMDLVSRDKGHIVKEWLATPEKQAGSGPWRGVFIGKDGRRRLMEGNSSVQEEDGRPVAIRSIFRDITAAHESAERLRQHAAKEQALFQTSEHMFWTVDRRTALTGFNQGYSDMIHRLYGKRPEVNTDPERPKALFAPTSYHEFWGAKYAEVFSGRPVRFESDLIDLQGKRVCNEIFLSPVFNAEGHVVEAFGIGHEVTAAREVETKAREQAARLNALFRSSANMMIWTLDTGLRITSLNQHFQSTFQHAFGIRLGEGDNFLALLAEATTPDQQAEIGANYAAALKGTPRQFEVEARDVRGEERWVEAFLNPILVDGKVTEISCLAHDITAKKLAERAMLENLREKEVLLREVHHRVKNNLQIISSIFNLQKDHVDGDPRALAVLTDGQNRIRSMSYIHESLYQSKNFSQVDLGAYIGGLCRNLVMSYSLTGRVHLQTDLEEVPLEIDRAIPCGLIMNELISNALKHAFGNGGEGTVNVGLRERDGRVEISISDDGRGMPAEAGSGRLVGLGMELVDTLVGQIDGKLRRESVTDKRGTSYLLTFERS